MLINARPRIVSHGFETFVPIQRVESLHQRLVEMTNNDVNAWNFFRHAATPGNGWNESLDDFNNDENFPVSRSHPLGLRSKLTTCSFLLCTTDTTKMHL